MSDDDLIWRRDALRIIDYYAKGQLVCTTLKIAITNEIPAAAPCVKPLDENLSASNNGFALLVQHAIAEAEKAIQKFPQPNYVISKVAEEAGEVVKAAIHTAEGRETMWNLRGEMKQLIAMLYRLWVEGDQIHGLPPINVALDLGGGG